MSKAKATKTKPESFFSGKPIRYSAKRDRLQVTLTLKRGDRNEWKRGVDWGYTADVQASWVYGEVARAKAGWSYRPYKLRENCSFGKLFAEMVEYGKPITDMLHVRGNPEWGPSGSSLIRCVHEIQDTVEKDFLNSREDLSEKYFSKEHQHIPDD